MTGRDQQGRLLDDPTAPPADPAMDVVGVRGGSVRARLDSNGTPVWARLAFLAVALAVAYGLLAQVAFWFLRPSGGAAFYPPAGLAFAVLVLTPRRTWPLWLLAFATAAMSFGLVHDRPVSGLIGSVSANVAEPVVGALLFGAAIRSRRGLRAALISFALLPVVVAPLVSAVLNNSYKAIFAPELLERQSFWYFTRNWWCADALGVLVIGSLILVWARPTPFEDRAPPVAVAAVAATAATVIVAGGVLWSYTLISLALPALVWASCFGGTRAMATVGAAAALAANWVALTGRAKEPIEVLQLRIGVTFLAGLILAVEIAERRRSVQVALDAQRELATSEAAVRVAESERHRIVEYTHDIVGHGLNTMLLLVGAARVVLDDDPEKARELLATSEAIGQRACTDMDVALALGGSEHAEPPGPGLEQLPELVAALRDADLAIDLEVEGERGELSTLIDWCSYGVVREALTNVLKHAPRATTTVTVRYGDDAIHLSIVDHDVSERRGHSHAEGRGIIGMRARVVAVGGTFDARANPGGGFIVAATLPRRATVTPAPPATAHAN
jgi:signal transduction histidine kinase